MGVSGQPEADDPGGGLFAVDVRPGSGHVVLALSGELDHDTADPLRQALAAGVRAAPGRILVDCADLRFCDSTGLNVLLHARLAAADAGSRLELSGLRQPVRRMFEITGAHEVFQVHASLDDALADDRPG